MVKSQSAHIGRNLRAAGPGCRLNVNKQDNLEAKMSEVETYEGVDMKYDVCSDFKGAFRKFELMHLVLLVLPLSLSSHPAEEPLNQ